MNSIRFAPAPLGYRVRGRQLVSASSTASATTSGGEPVAACWLIVSATLASAGPYLRRPSFGQGVQRGFGVASKLAAHRSPDETGLDDRDLDAQQAELESHHIAESLEPVLGRDVGSH